MARKSLSPGFRFHPTHLELVMYFLKRKVKKQKFHFNVISELNVYKFSPWDLPDKSCLRSKDLEWYFFCPREKKYASGSRSKRSTETGYWKATGRDREVHYKERTVGMVKTLVFHEGHAPGGERTNWVMHEYRIVDKDLSDAGVVLDAYVICKVFQKSGTGPKNGAQYGAPFNEDEWNDDVETCVESLPSDGMPSAAPALSDNQNNSIVTCMVVPKSACTSDPGPSTGVPSAEEMSPVLPKDGTLLPFVNETNEKRDDLDCDKTTYAAVSSLDGHDIYKGLGVLANWEELSKGVFDFSSSQEAGYALNPMLPGGDVPFLELNDLDFPLNFSAEQMSTNNLCAPLNCYSNLEEGFYGGNVLGAVQYVPCSSQLSKLPEGSNWEELSKGGFDFSSSQEAGYALNPILPGGDVAFLELNDLDSPLNFSAEKMSTDSLCAPLNCYSNLEEGCSGGNVLGAVQYVPCLSQLSKLPEGSNLQGGHYDVSGRGRES